MEITNATAASLPILGQMGCLLWPDSSLLALTSDFAQIMKRPDAAFFLAWEAGKPVGFAQCQLRHDYVEGAKTSPVGYLEGIYVEPSCRRRGIGRALVERCRQWAGDWGCTEFASDCELSNTASQRFHEALGFTETNRVICYKIPLLPGQPPEAAVRSIPSERSERNDL